jgi:type I restriction enzyme M protein
MLFLKYLDDLETEITLEAQMTGGVFKPLFDEQYRWSVWATP